MSSQRSVASYFGGTAQVVKVDPKPKGKGGGKKAGSASSSSSKPRASSKSSVTPKPSKSSDAPKARACEADKGKEEEEEPKPATKPEESDEDVAMDEQKVAVVNGADTPAVAASAKRKAAVPVASDSEDDDAPVPAPVKRGEAANGSSKRARRVVADEDSDEDNDVEMATAAVKVAPSPPASAAKPAAIVAEESAAEDAVAAKPADKKPETKPAAKPAAKQAAKPAPVKKPVAAAPAAKKAAVVAAAANGKGKGRTKAPEEDEEEEEEAASDAEEDDEDNEEGEEESGSEDEVEEAEGEGGGKNDANSRLMAAARRLGSASGKKAAKKGGSKAGTTGMTAYVKAMPKAEALVADAGWEAGAPVPYEKVVDAFCKIETEPSRLAIQEIVRQLLVKVMVLSPDDLPPVLYLLSSLYAPAYEGVELGVGRERLIKAIAQATGKKVDIIKKEAANLGLAEIAGKGRGAQARLSFAKKPARLTARGVLKAYRNIASGSGEEHKIKGVLGLLNAAQKEEARFVIKGMEKNLGIGLALKTVLTALAHAAASCQPHLPGAGVLGNAPEEAPTDADMAVEAAHNAEKADPEAAAVMEGEEDEASAAPAAETGTELSESALAIQKLQGKQDSRSREERMEAAAKLVRQAFNECPNYEELADALRSAPLHLLQRRCSLKVGVPVAPMLAKPEKSIAKAMARVGVKAFTCEYKYDGERAQIHMYRNGDGKAQLRIFSRNSEDNTGKYPDLLPVLEQAVAAAGVTDCVLDTEVVAVAEGGVFKPFQAVLNRKRKDVTLENIEIPVALQAFDLMYLNGRSLLRMPLVERRRLMHENFTAEAGKFDFAVSLDCQQGDDTEPVEVFLAEAVAKNCEGLMVKTLDGVYEPAERANSWMKLKKDYLGPEGGSMADSIDLVPIGAFFGKGKRQGKYGAFLLACYDPDTEQYQSICKIGTGFSDELLDSLHTRFKEKTIPSKPQYFLVKDTIKPDVWFDPEYVWEVKGADMTISPNHSAAVGKVDPKSGISIRFPRLIGEREDKSPQQATSASEVVHFYSSQDVVKNNLTGGGNVESDGEL